MLTNEAMFTGLNPTGTEARLFAYKGTTFSASVEQPTLKLFPSTKPRIRCLELFPLEGEDFHILWYLQFTCC